MALSTTQNFGNQNTTQSPQASTAPANNATLSSNVQPGTAASVLTSKQGTLLGSSALTTVNLSAATPATTGQQNDVKPAHHFNSTLLVLPLLLLVIAVASVLFIQKSVKKSTTNY
jgi:hypothetical protein